MSIPPDKVKLQDRWNSTVVSRQRQNVVEVENPHNCLCEKDETQRKQTWQYAKLTWMYHAVNQKFRGAGIVIPQPKVKFGNQVFNRVYHLLLFTEMFHQTLFGNLGVNDGHKGVGR